MFISECLKIIEILSFILALTQRKAAAAKCSQAEVALNSKQINLVVMLHQASSRKIKIIKRPVEGIFFGVQMVPKHIWA